MAEQEDLIVIAALASRMWLGAKFLLLALAVFFYGAMLPGLWPAGVPLGIIFSFFLTRHVVRQYQGPPPSPSFATAVACYVFAGVPAFLALFVVGAMAQVMRDGPAYEETILGVALGFFLYPTYKLVRWGRGFQLAARGSAKGLGS
ncbi:MAG TPA: hypothetical protein VIT45_12550 [Allosphingosinicella sp.]